MIKATTNKNSVKVMSKYTPELLVAAQLYADCYETIYGEVVPSFAGLAVVLKVRKATLNTWKNDKTKREILEIFDQIENKQEVLLLNKGLIGKFNSSISKLILGKHGYHDKQDNKFTGNIIVEINSEDAGML